MKRNFQTVKELLLRIKFLFVDLFCGAGGTSSGIHMAERIFEEVKEKIAEVVACVNHDANAIKSHEANFEYTKHYTEDIRTVGMQPIIDAILARKKYWEDLGYRVFVCLWASLECTNFSKAKGGQARDADSRTLAEHLFRYLAFLYDYIWIENVEEFMSWGPLDINGKPESRNAGKDYMKWVNDVMEYGYEYDYKILNAADYGAYTSRKRYFGCFAKIGLPIKFPLATHGKNPDNGMFSSLKKWMPVKECLDFEDKGKSIFDRKKPLSPKTLERIYAGLVKYVAGGKKEFIAKYNSYSLLSGYKHTAADVNDPCPVISTQNRLGLVQTSFIQKYYSGRPEGKVISLEGPSGTITCIDSQSLVQTEFLTKYHGNGENILSIEGPCSTLSTKDRIGFIQPQYWLDKQYTNKDNHQSVDAPAGTIMQNDKHALVKAVQNQKWILSTNFNNVGSDIESPAPTITANRKHNYLMNPAWGGNNGDIDNPCCTIVARQDKAPLYFITVDSKAPMIAIAVFDDDIEIMIKIKEFMALYNITDIQMRMLKIIELLRIQGFINPNGVEDDYTLIGTQTEKKKYIGNSVVPLQVKALLETMYESLMDHARMAA